MIVDARVILQWAMCRCEICGEMCSGAYWLVRLYEHDDGSATFLDVYDCHACGATVTMEVLF